MVIFVLTNTKASAANHSADNTVLCEFHLNIWRTVPLPAVVLALFICLLAGKRLAVFAKLAKIIFPAALQNLCVRACVQVSFRLSHLLALEAVWAAHAPA